MMINCREATRLSSESHERSLAWWERAQLTFHEAMCRLCKQFHRDVGSLHALAESAGEHAAADEQLAAEARNRIKAALNEQRGG